MSTHAPEYVTERESGKRTDRLLQTLGGILLAVIAFFCQRLWERSDRSDERSTVLESRVVKAETRQDNTDCNLKEIKDTLKEGFAEIKSDLKSMRNSGK